MRRYNFDAHRLNVIHDNRYASRKKGSLLKFCKFNLSVAVRLCGMSALDVDAYFVPVLGVLSLVLWTSTGMRQFWPWQ